MCGRQRGGADRWFATGALAGLLPRVELLLRQKERHKGVPRRPGGRPGGLSHYLQRYDS